MVKLWKKIILGCVLCLIIPVLASASGQEPVVRVGILENQAQVTISAENDFVMKVLAEQHNYRFPAGKQLVFTYKQGKALLNNKPLRGNDIIIAVKAKSPVLINNHPYRGALNILINNRGITVVNRLPMEDYLYGVVPAEMPYNWPQEALKAQAVAARTFALHYKKVHENDGKPYELCNTTVCQVYKGLGGERPGVKEAVDKTRGQVLTYNNEPIAAVFHAASGGSTISSEEGWGSKVPYLQGTLDKNEKSPYANWSKEYSEAEFARILSKKFPGLQKVKKVDLSKYPRNQIASTEKSITIIDGKNVSHKISGSDFRSLFNLDSSNFTVETIYGTVPVMQAKQSNVAAAKPVLKPGVATTNHGKRAKHVKGNLYGSTAVASVVAKEVAAAKEAVGAVQAAVKNQHVVMVKVPVKFKIIGSGLGHRIGMSQWGAKGDAEAGKDYVSILKHYYNGVQLERLY